MPVTRTGLQSCPPEICSLICQDPTLERLDLNSICYISHTFRSEAQRELSYCYPRLRGVSDAKAWCSALQSKPSRATNVKGLVLLFPRSFLSDFLKEDIERLAVTMNTCVNLKELGVVTDDSVSALTDSEVEDREYPTRYTSPNDLLSFTFHGFKLTKFVNHYCFQTSYDLQLGPGSRLGTFLRSQPNLELLELHSEKTSVHKSRLSLPYLTALGCPPQFLDASHSTTRLRLNFQKPTELPLSPFFNLGSSEINQLKRVLDENQTRQMKSLALFLWKKESKFSEIIRVIASNHIYIQHLEIHQSLPIQVEKDLPLPIYSYGRNIKTLVYRPPPGLPKKDGDNPNLCAYICLRTPVGRRKVAEKLIMRTLPTLTRLVFIVHGNDYEFRKNSFTGVITGEKKLLSRDTQEWAWVK